MEVDALLVCEVLVVAGADTPASDALNLSPSAWVCSATALIALEVTDTQRAFIAGVDRPVLSGWMGPPGGVYRLVIGACVSQGTLGSYGGRVPPGGILG